MDIVEPVIPKLSLDTLLPKYRISYYHASEVVDGRAPRYMADIEAPSLKEAKAQVEDYEVIIRSVYPAPKKPLRKTPSYLYLSEEARNFWYKNKYNPQHPRRCPTCKINPVEKFQRRCPDCESKLKGVTARQCKTCEVDLKVPRIQYCPNCLKKRTADRRRSSDKKRVQEREPYLLLLRADRLKTQIEWAKEQIEVVTVRKCNLASRFKGSRLPHTSDSPRRCRFCLQKFIDVQTPVLIEMEKRGKVGCLSSK